MTQFLSQTRYDDWIVYAALLPALLTLGGIGITAAIAWHNQALWTAGCIAIAMPTITFGGWPSLASSSCLVMSLRRLWISFLIVSLATAIGALAFLHHSKNEAPGRPRQPGALVSSRHTGARAGPGDGVRAVILGGFRREFALL